MVTDAPFPDAELPEWTRGSFWTRVAAADDCAASERAALDLGADDPLLPVNYHAMRIGPQNRLHENGRTAFEQIQSELGLRSSATWRAQRPWIEAVFRWYFPHDCPYPGWWSLLSARKPAQLRKEQDPGIHIDQSPARVYWSRRGTVLERRRTLSLGDVRIPGAGLRMARRPDVRRSDLRLAMTVVPRLVRASRLDLVAHYDEAWLCVADRERDNARLAAGQIPAVSPATYFHSLVRVRQSCLLNLVRVAKDLWSTALVIELDPDSAEVLSIRWIEMPVAAGLMVSSPVERDGLEAAFRELQT